MSSTCFFSANHNLPRGNTGYDSVMYQELNLKYTILAASLSILFLTSCAHTVFAPPKVLYSTQSTVGVKYRSSGIQSFYESEKAMEIISNHCNDRYEITNRNINDGWTTVDAHCIQ